MGREILAVGLMSGTSADGVTAALVRFSGRSVQVLRCRTFPYAPALKARVLTAAGLKTPELSRLNMELGEAFARAALIISRDAGPVAVIGSHGQTVWHGPKMSPPNTLQLGEPSVIAERLGIYVVADFRPRDMAAGGEGAPLIPAFDEFLFAAGPLRALQNIGGIGNVSFAGEGRLWSAFDTGPGNGLMDLAARLVSGGRLAMDSDGKLAAQGRPDLKKVEVLLTHPYFREAPPKSLDKDFFGLDFLRRRLGPLSYRRLPDIMASLSLFTARSIAQSYRLFSPRGRKIAEVVVSGGGAKNPGLMRNLRLALSPLPVVVSDRYGLPVMAKEAAGFAWMAVRAIQGKVNHCPAATGARGKRILGKITPALALLAALGLQSCVGYPRPFLARKSGIAAVEPGKPLALKAAIVKSCETLQGETETVKKSKDVSTDEKGRYSFWITGLSWNWTNFITLSRCRSRVQLYVCRPFCKEVDEVDLSILGK
ncbi:MAG: anhydro-N-acetylmuramic acid kinase [Elusimicrobia bacterium]|nr:anhydro-N-acetylmuramic acid kinase [Elusimicrobiota bacterium]